MDGDASWDDDFEFDSAESGLRIPPGVRNVSDTVKHETQAARATAAVVTELRDILVHLPRWRRAEPVQKAVALVHASLDGSDVEFYGSEAWKHFRQHDLTVEAQAFEQVLEAARQCLAELQEELASLAVQ